ncbi:hypothetical protein ACJX0J_017743, partial [Zea mays]
GIARIASEITVSHLYESIIILLLKFKYDWSGTEGSRLVHGGELINFLLYMSEVELRTRGLANLYSCTTVYTEPTTTQVQI